MVVNASIMSNASTYVNAYGKILGMTTTELPGDLTDLQACCTPLTGGVIDSAAAERIAVALKALAEPTRIRLISMIAAQPAGEACVCDLTGPVGLSQPTVSHHLKTLVDAGILTRQQRTKWAYYRLVPGALDAVGSLLSGATCNPA
jgi:ArsR family transcriptional regulator